MSKEKLRKTNAVDCSKLARELHSGSLKGNYVLGWEPQKYALYKTKKPDCKGQHMCQEPYQVVTSFS